MVDIRTKSPSREETERRAYEIYVARGRQSGRDIEDWFAAEDELAQQATTESRQSNTISMTKPRAVAAGRDRI
ncbi:MAG: DUF2934 domain-containing protein [Candidatus Acidiferrales bacterium]